MGASLKEKGKELVSKGYQTSKVISSYKKSYKKYKELYELGSKLVDPDTRDATAFKEALKYMLKAAGNLIEADLTKSPYYVLNQKGMEALFEAITAMDTINNARKLLDEAEGNLGKLATQAADFEKQYNAKWHDYYESIKLVYAQHRWILYVQQLNMDRFDGATIDAAEDEVRNAIELATALLSEIRPTVDKVLNTGIDIFTDFAGLAASGGEIVLAEKTYEAKIGKLVDSKGTISHGFGSLERGRKTTEDGYDALENKKGAGKSLSSRVNSVLEGPNKTMNSWTYLIDNCLSERVLMLGVWGGMELPWNLALPEK